LLYFLLTGYPSIAYQVAGEVFLIIYDYDDYRKALKEALLEKKNSLGTAFTFQNMAKACRIQKTYLSKVLNDRGDLSGDQLYLACEYLGFNGEDREFIFLIFEEARTVVQKRKSELRSQISRIRKSYIKTELHLKSSALPTDADDFSDYYLDPYAQVVHMFLTVDRFAKMAGTIAERLHITSEFLAEILTKLQRLGIVEMRAGQYYVVKDNIHLSRESTLYRPYRNLLRMKANERIDILPSERSYNFSVIFSTNPRTKQKIHAAFLEFLRVVQEMVGKTKADEVYQMNFDLFGWSD
jgi:uncharacterized protein (TIGR02147 family)